MARRCLALWRLSLAPLSASLSLSSARKEASLARSSLAWSRTSWERTETHCWRVCRLTQERSRRRWWGCETQKAKKAPESSSSVVRAWTWAPARRTRPKAREPGAAAISKKGPRSSIFKTNQRLVHFVSPCFSWSQPAASSRASFPEPKTKRFSKSGNESSFFGELGRRSTRSAAHSACLAAASSARRAARTASALGAGGITSGGTTSSFFGSFLAGAFAFSLQGSASRAGSSSSSSS
mmetsp:Transcript_7610/g.23511  ORF Transcript_7610/g.23511 Transcript_7610/m.23511 type:complete len:238 (-) Transcript_7610:387-1100(-)